MDKVDIVTKDIITSDSTQFKGATLDISRSLGVCGFEKRV